MRIVPATMGDMQALSHFAGQEFTRTFSRLYGAEHLAAHLQKMYSPDYFAACLTQDSILLVRDDERLIGYAKFGAIGVPITPATAHDRELHRFYLHPAYHGRGIADAMMQAVLDATQQAPNLYLGVYSENLRAQRFYARYGFEKVGEYDYIVGPHTDLEWILKRENA